MVQLSRIAFIKAGWHSDIVNQSLSGFKSVMAKEASSTIIDVYNVPGAFEIPLMAQNLAQKNIYDVIIASAFVVNGGIYRHEFVAQAVVTGLMDVQLKTQTPVLSVVLTPHNYHENSCHQEFFYNHFFMKGEEAAKACLMLFKPKMAEMNLSS